MSLPRPSFACNVVIDNLLFLTDLLFNKKVVDWGISEVSIWLDSVGCGEYKGIFNQHDIRGPELIALEKTDLHVCRYIHTINFHSTINM